MLKINNYISTSGCVRKYNFNRYKKYKNIFKSNFYKTSMIEY